MAKFEIAGIQVKGIPTRAGEQSPSSKTDAVADTRTPATATRGLVVVLRRQDCPKRTLPLKDIASEILLIHEDRVRPKLSFG